MQHVVRKKLRCCRKDTNSGARGRSSPASPHRDGLAEEGADAGEPPVHAVQSPGRRPFAGPGGQARGPLAGARLQCAPGCCGGPARAAWPGPRPRTGPGAAGNGLLARRSGLLRWRRRTHARRGGGHGHYRGRGSRDRGRTMARGARPDARRAVRGAGGVLAPQPLRAGVRLGVSRPVRSRCGPAGHRACRGALPAGRRGDAAARTAGRGARRRAAARPPRDGPPPAARRRSAHVPLQALPPRGAGAPLGLASHAREHGPSGRGRAPARASPVGGGPGRVAPRLRAPAGPGRPHRGPRGGGRGVQGVLRAGVVARGGGRRLQPARARSRPRLAGDRHAPRLCQVPAAGPLRPEPVLHRGHPERQPGARPRARRPVPRALRPGGGERSGGRRRAAAGRGGARGRRPGLRDRGADPRGPRSGLEPRRGPHPADLLRAHRRDPAHQFPPARAGRRPSPVPGPEARSVVRARDAGAEAARRDLRVLAAARGGAPARRPDRARRDPLVGSARGLPHRGAGAPQDPDGEERGDRAGGLQGRLRAQAPARRSGRARRGGARLLPGVHRRPARADGQLCRPRGGERDRAPARHRAPRRRRPLPGGRGRQGHRDLLRPRERAFGRGRILARRRLRVGGLGRLRPQGHRDYRAGRLGVGQEPLPGARARPRGRRRSRWPASAT